MIPGEMFAFPRTFARAYSYKNGFQTLSVFYIARYLHGSNCVCLLLLQARLVSRAKKSLILRTAVPAGEYLIISHASHISSTLKRG